MKVVIVTKYLMSVRGGVENHCYNLAKELVRNGVVVEIHAWDKRKTIRNSFGMFGEDNNVKIFNHSRPFVFFLKDIDIIHIHNFYVFPYAWIFLGIFYRRVLKMKSPKLIVTLHGGFTPMWSLVPSIGSPFKKFYHATMGKLFLNFVVDVIVALTEIERAELIKNGIKASKIVVIPNGVDDLAYKLPQQKSTHFERYKPYVAFIGRISKVKNIEFMVRCLKNFDELKFLVAGQIQETKYYQDLMRLSERLGVSDRVIFLGVVSDKEKYELIDNSLALVLFSHHETEPIVVKESLVRGKPVIVRNAPYSLSFSSKCVIPVSDGKELERIIVSLMQNRGLEQTTSCAEIIKQWRWSSIVKRILNIYKRMLRVSRDGL